MLMKTISESKKIQNGGKNLVSTTLNEVDQWELIEEKQSVSTWAADELYIIIKTVCYCLQMFYYSLIPALVPTLKPYYLIHQA